MPSADDAVDAIVAAKTWDKRIALIRKVPESFGIAQHAGIYAAVAKKFYVPRLAPDFAYIHSREEYELETVQESYNLAFDATQGFTVVDVDTLQNAIKEHPKSLLVFRLLLGFTAQEFAASCSAVSEELNIKGPGPSSVKNIEGGSEPTDDAARCSATVMDRAMRGELFPDPPSDELYSKLDKPDTEDGWDTVAKFAAEGVPFATFLHQRHYGGAFRQILDATSSKRGDILETAVEDLFKAKKILYLRTGSSNQKEIAKRFGITVKPAPDFVVFDKGDNLKAILECKAANDGGTARDKAARFRSLRTEATRLGGVPLFAVLAGLGWTRTQDALGPVIRDTDGRTFTLATLEEMLTVQPFPGLVK